MPEIKKKRKDGENFSFPNNFILGMLPNELLNTRISFLFVCSTKADDYDF